MFYSTLQETDDATAHYDADSKSFVVTVPKKVKGEHFPGLEMISDLLIPKGDTKLPNGPLVEVLSGVITTYVILLFRPAKSDVFYHQCFARQSDFSLDVLC